MDTITLYEIWFDELARRIQLDMMLEALDRDYSGDSESWDSEDDQDWH